MEFKVMQGNQSNYEQQIDDVIAYSDVQYSFHKHGGKSDSYKSGDCPKEVCTYSSHSLHLIFALVTIMIKKESEVRCQVSTVKAQLFCGSGF
jgi:hypothetical protein